MSANPDYNLENAKESKRLREMALRVSNTQLAVLLPNGWTVAAAFAHLAFWDLRQLAVLKKWIKEGVSDVKVAPAAVESINEAVNTLSEAIPAQSTVALAIYAAGLIDQAVENITPELAAEILRQGHERMLRRSLHRKDHLDKIEKALAG